MSMVLCPTLLFIEDEDWKNEDKRKDKKHMNTITSNQLYNLITSEKLSVKLVASKYFSMMGVANQIEKEKFMEDLEKVTHAGKFDIIEWTVYISKDGTVTLTTDLHDSIAGEYIEVLGTVSDGMSIEQFWEELD